MKEGGAALFGGASDRTTMLADPELDPPFEIVEPDVLTNGIVLSSPHSGQIYPARFLASARLDAASLRRSEDAFVDELFLDSVALGAPLLRARFPRAYLDVNREPYELDPRMFEGRLPAYANTRSMRVASGLGTIARVVGEAQEIYAKRLSVEEGLHRIESLHKPYHAALHRLIDRSVARFGRALLIDCHSMPSCSGFAPSGAAPAGTTPPGATPLGATPLGATTGGPAGASNSLRTRGAAGPTKAANPMPVATREDRPKADFVLGDRYGTSCDRIFIDAVEYELRQFGYMVERNKPYAGGFITEHYGQPALHRHALQIEINRALYMDERNMQRRESFAVLSSHITSVIRAVSGLIDDGYAARRAAAE